MEEISFIRLNLSGCQIVGTVPCGAPESPLSDCDGEELESWLSAHPKQTYYLRLAGTSMIGFGLSPGMVVAVDCSGNLEPRRGDVILAKIDGADYTLKSWEPPYLVGDTGRERIEILIEPERVIEVVGVAVGVWSKWR